MKASGMMAAAVGNGIRFGVNAKLQLAFGAVAILTVVAALMAMFTFNGTGRGVERVAGHEMPVVTDALRLSAVSADISASAARFVSARTPYEQAVIGTEIGEKNLQLGALMERLRAARGASPAFAEVEAVSQRLAANLKQLQDTISERSLLRAQLETRLDAVRQVHARLSTRLTPIVDDSYFDVVMTAESMSKGGERAGKGVVADQIAALRSALEIAAQTHLATSLISEAAGTKDPAAVVPVQERFRAAARLLAKATADLGDAEVKKNAAQLIAFGEGTDSLFALRARELAASARADQAIMGNVAIERELDRAVSALVGETETAMKNGAAELIHNLVFNSNMLLIVALVSIVAGGMSVSYVQRRLIGRLTAIRDAMQRLSSGTTDLAVPAVADKDELGEMGRSLEVFRAGEIERRGYAARRDAEQVAQRDRAAAIEAMIGAFRAAVTAVIAAVTDNISRMEATARTLSGIAGEADNQVRSASSASEITSANVRGVAGATEELGASIGQISQQATQANGVV